MVTYNTGKGDIPSLESWMRGPLLSGSVDPINPYIDLSWLFPSGSDGFPPYDSYPGASSLSIYRSDNGGAFSVLASGLSIAAGSYVDMTPVSTHYYSYYVAVVFPDGSLIKSNTIVMHGEIDDVFLTTGTWVARPGLKSAQVIAIGPGGGGQGGFATVYGATVCEGNGGGSGGGYASCKIPAANLPATAPVVVGLGGRGGSANTVIYPAGAAVQTNGTAGTSATSFNGTWVVANPGTFGTGSSAVTGGTASISAPGATNTFTETGGSGGAPSGGANSDSHRNGGTTTTGAGPGGAGGGCASAPTQSSGTVAGFTQNGGASPTAAAGAGGAGAGSVSSTTNQTGAAAATAAAGPSDSAGGGGGGGGTGITGSSTSNLIATGGNGANGGPFGAGGGGGGSAEATAGGNFIAATAISGTGGSGANGVCVVKNLFW